MTIFSTNNSKYSFVPFVETVEDYNNHLVIRRTDSKSKLKTLETKYTEESSHQSHTIVYTLAHEIRNPLTNIRLSLELIESDGIDDSLRPYIDIISRNTNRINDLISNMLYSFTRKKEQPKEYSINMLLDQSLEMANDRILLKSIKIEKNYDYQLCEVLLEESVVKIAFLNIIINAIEAMSNSTGVLKITTALINEKCTVYIEDNGTGISPLNLKKLFDPFFSTKPSGIGLGLSATLHILQSQQADVQVESEEGKGTRFIISF